MSLHRKQFIRLKKPPFYVGSITGSPFVWIGNNEIAFAIGLFNSHSEQQKADQGIWVYNTISNKWRLHIKYPKDFKSTVADPGHTMCYNAKTDVLWLYGDERDMFNIKMLTKEFKLINSKTKPSHSAHRAPKILFIDDDLHAICSWDNNQHLVWNNDTKTFDKSIFTFPDLPKGLHGHVVIHLKQKNVIYLFGGYINSDSGGYGFQYSIWKCDITDTKGYKWNKLDLSLERSCCDKGAISTPDERYIILFTNPIGILDTDKHRFYSVSVRGLIHAQYAVLGENAERDRVMLHGYIRTFSKDLGSEIPMDIFEVIVQYCSINTWVYLLGAEFYKIDPNDIIALIEED